MIGNIVARYCFILSVWPEVMNSSGVFVKTLYRVVLLVELVVKENADDIRHQAVFRLRGVSGVMCWIFEQN